MKFIQSKENSQEFMKIPDSNVTRNMTQNAK